jgi:hypothetical protein
MTFREFIENEKKEEINFLIEGIDIDKHKKIVTFNSSHDNNVSTSIELNPTYDYINKYPVISIFKRKKSNDGFDGNPLVYALKGIKGWTISKRDIILLLKQFIKISEKIEYKYDTIISIPSSKSLNNDFLYRLNEIIKCECSITDGMFSKMEVEEVVDNIEYDKMTKEEQDKMVNAISKMGAFFTFKEVPSGLRKYIKNIWNDNFSCHGLTYADKINGKNILVLDDTISSGQTISTYCENIINNYTPKSITIVTLFSKLT